MTNNFGKKRTYVPWEPYVKEEKKEGEGEEKEEEKEKGVIVVPDFQWIYFVSCTVVETLKQKLNQK